MITTQEFDYGMALLSSHFGKELSPGVKVIWQEYLDAELTSSEFMAAVKNSVLHSRFMPTAGELVEFIQGGKEAKAIQEWQIIVSAAKSNTEQSKQLLSYLSMRSTIGLRAIGGISVIANAESEKERSYLQKQFVTVYCQCSDKDIKVLPQVPGTVHEVSPKEKTQQQKEEPVSEPIPEHLKKQMDDLISKMGKRGSK